MDRVNGAPFWVIRKDHLWARGNPPESFDYNVWYIEKYLYHGYPIIEIYRGSGEAYVQRLNITLALTRQLSDLDEDSWAFWDFADVERALLMLKLKGYTINPFIEHKSGP